MGHHVGGGVARPRVLAGIATGRGLGAPTPLRRGLSPLPIDGENVGGLAASGPEPTPLAFEHLTPAVLAALTELSAGCRLASIETDYFGGVGGQGAVVRDGGRVVMRPLRGDGPRGPVSRALAHLSVCVGPPYFDEFDAVGLGDVRSNQAWRRASASR